jgi:glucose uptake protein GlcU
MNILAFALSLMLVIAATLAGAYITHEKVMQTEKNFIVYEIFSDCVSKNDKAVCQHILTRLKKGT